MNQNINEIPGGTITSPQGFQAGGVYCGIKAYGEEKMDLGLLYSEKPCAAAAVFTTNKVTGPAIRVCREHLKSGKAQALIVNSGIANVAVGEQGYKDAKSMTELAARKLGLKSGDVLVASTGVIGVELPMAVIRSGLDKINLSRDGGRDLARAILTTDTHPKQIAVSFKLGGKEVHIGGIAKGAGMIHPNMATTLCFVATDASVEQGFLQSCLKEVVDTTFNMVSVDGDTSTSDTLAVFANGMAGNPVISAGQSGPDIFKKALRHVLTYLAKQVARDGEGATKLIEVKVEGAKSLSDARKAARAISTSLLVKCAIHGNDPNWGRIMCALGYSGAEIEESKVDLFINDMFILNDGTPVPFYPDAVSKSLDQENVVIKLVLNLGDALAIAWTCDMSEEYVTFNSEYTT